MKTKQTGPIQLAIVGSGLAVKWLHWPALKNLAEHYRIVTTCDVDPKAAQEVAAMAATDLNSPDCTWTTDYKEVLANERVEAVLLSLPIHLNSQFVLDAARAGKHILVEKPVAANLEQAQDLANTLRPFTHLTIEVAENFHYRADIQKAKAWLQAGRIGEPFLLEMTSHFWTDTSDGFAATPWRHDAQYRGGIVTDAGVHHAAGLRELGGEIEQLQAFTRSTHPVMRGYDVLLLNVRFRNGIIGNLTFAGAVKTTNNDFIQAHIYGTTGTIHLTNGKVVLSEGFNDKAQIVEEHIIPDFDTGYTAEFENFYRAIRKGEAVVATLDEAVRDLTILMRAYDSSESRSVILL